jgi:hypothetical protein
MNARRRTVRALLLTLAVLAAAGVAAAAAGLAAAEPFPAQHFELTSLGGEPLRGGFVEVAHPDGPRVFARHVYQLNGARRHASYDVAIAIWTSSLACAGAPDFVLPAAVLVTNDAGNGLANVTFPPELLSALGLRGLTIGGTVTLARDGSPAYTTGCRINRLD